MGSFKIWSRRGKVDQLNMVDTSTQRVPTRRRIEEDRLRLQACTVCACASTDRYLTLISPFGPSAATTDYGGTVPYSLPYEYSLHKAHTS